MFIALFVLLASRSFAAGETSKVVLLPVEATNTGETGKLGRDIYEELAGQLRLLKSVQLVTPDVAANISAKQIDKAYMYKAGMEAGGAYVIAASLQESDGSFTVVVRILDIRKNLFLPEINIQGKSGESSGKISSRIMADVLLRIGAEQRIVNIIFKGNHRIESTSLYKAIKSTKGSLFVQENLAEDIKSIYKMGSFNDVSAQVTDSPDGKTITFILQEKAIVKSVVVKGNKKFGQKEIEDLLSMKAGEVLDREKIRADLKKIKDFYDGKGYYNANVTDTVEKVGESDVRLTYAIDENNQLYVIHIFFSGNEAFTKKELIKLMATKEKGFFSFITDSGLLKKEQLNQDMEKIAAYYLNHGFIRVQVAEPVITHDKKGTTIRIAIVEGKQYQVGNVEIGGDKLDVPASELLPKLLVTKKSYYDREAVMRDIDFLQKACNDEGYAYAEVSPEVIPHDKNYKIDVIYRINKGTLVHFNRITISGNTKTRDKVIRRLLTVAEGDLYSKSKLKESYEEINRLRYFEEVDFQTQKGKDEALTDINIQVKEKPTGMFSVGAGYSAQDNAVFTATVSQQNLFGKGQNLDLKANFGSRTTNYEISFVEPWLFDLPLWAKLDVWKTDRLYDTYSMKSEGGGGTFGYPLWKNFTGYIGYRLSTDNVYDIYSNASSLIRRQMGKIVSSSVNMAVTRDTTNDNYFPSKGSKSTFSVEYTGGFLGGDASFTKYQLSSSWFYGLPWNMVFGVKGRGGYLQEREGKEAPVYERFILGGIGTLRGLRSVGPVDPLTGDTIGGLRVMNFSAELLFPLLKEAGMKGVVFFDTGNSWVSGYDFGDMRRTAGAGIRWFSPIGPLRLEWGHVLDQRNGEPTSRWEFTIGMLM